MPDSTNTQLAPFIERARKVLQYEQRGNHQDRVVNGGLELFVVRWADEVSAICKNAELDLKPIHRFTEHLEGYRRQDPMQRASSLRAALAILDSLDGYEQRSKSAPATPATPTTPATPATLHAQTRASISSKPTATEKTAPKSAAKPSPVAPQNPIRLDAGMSPGHTALTLLGADVTAIPGVGASVAARLHHLGIRTVRDLLFYF